MNIKKSIKVIFVDFMALFIGLLNGFLLPKFLNLESYALIKTFGLYIAYSGMFHFGFSDGMYILLGGKNIDEIKMGKIKGYLFALIKILFIVLIGFILLANFIIKDTIFYFFIIYTIPLQITLFVSLLYRATGDFDKYVVIKIIINIFNLLSTVFILFVNNSPYIYMLIQCVGYLIIALIYTIKIFSSEFKIENISASEIKLLISTGFIIMIANTTNNLFFSLDRWFVKFKFSVEEFAFYSFGVSMMNLFITLITSVTIIFYPYLAKSKGNYKIIRKIKKYIIVITSFVPAGYFILEIIVNKYIQNYIPSLDILGILILSIPFITIINVLYANLYKVNNEGKVYLFTAIKMLIIALILNCIVVYIFNNSVTIAYATLISLVIWYIYSSNHFVGLRIQRKESIHFSIYIVAYILVKTSSLNSMLKVLVFIISISTSIIIFYKKEVKELVLLILQREQVSENLD